MNCGVNTPEVAAGALTKAGLAARDIATVGIANQRETTIVWDRRSGEPVHNMIESRQLSI